MEKKLVTVVELESFLSAAKKILSEKEKDFLVWYVASHPTFGDEIPGTGGLRKFRWPGKGKGKRGGLRIIYFFYNENHPIFLLTVYSKGDREDLTQSQKSILTEVAEGLKEKFKRKNKK